MYPALAVAEALRAEQPAAAAPAGAPAPASAPFGSADGPRLLYVGSIDGMERGLVERESDLPFRAIPAAALRGRSPLAAARGVATNVGGTRAALQLIREERPAAILGTGGYVCVPLFLAARAARVPTIIYLPDVVPGLAVRLLARLATAIACHVEDSLNSLQFRRSDLRLGPESTATDARNARVQVVGYPVRAEMFGQDRRQARAAFELAGNDPVLLVYGGSRGARSINRAVAALLPHLLPLARIIHVCGREGDEAFLREAADRLPEALRARYRLFPYLHSGGAGDGPSAPTMIRAFGAADVALCRSGASTMAELPAAGLPAVLVPYPYVHQDENADYLARRGAAVKVADDAMLGTGQPEDGPLFRALHRLLADEAERTRMHERSLALARPGAAQRLAHMLIDIASRKGRYDY